MADLKEVLNEWQHNNQFREAFKKNPEEALRQAGFIISTDDLNKIRAMLKLDKFKNDKLDDRVTK